MDITYRTRIIDLEDRAPHPHPRRRRAAEYRQAWDGLRTAVRAIRTGRTVVRTVSPRQMAKYGLALPTNVAVQFVASARRKGLGQRLRALTGGDERASWAQRNRDLAAKQYATNVQRRRARHTTRTI